jgi:hypothetical protein
MDCKEDAFSVSIRVAQVIIKHYKVSVVDCSLKGRLQVLLVKIAAAVFILVFLRSQLFVAREVTSC